MSWDSTNKIITDPVSIEDISTALVKNSGDLGTLCKYHVAATNKGINKWAKYKPVIFAAKSTLSQLNDDKTWNDNVSAPWWRATDGKCGFTVNVYTLGSTLVSAYEAGTDWVYTAPTGGSSAPYRQTDFNRYVHKPSYLPFYVSVSATYSESEGCYVFYPNTSSNVGVHFTFSSSSSDLLKITDFINNGNGGIWSTSIDNIYCGVLASIGYESTSFESANKIWITNTNPVGTEVSGSGAYEREVTLPSSLLSNVIGNNIVIKLYPYISGLGTYASDRIYESGEDAGFGSTSGTAGVVACPIDVSDFKVYVKQAALIASATCVCNRNLNNNTFSISYTYTVTLRGATSYSCTSGQIFLCQPSPDTMEAYTGDKFQGYPLLTSRQTVSNMGFNLSGDGDTHTFSGTWYIGVADASKDVFGNELTQIRFCMTLDDGNAGSVNLLTNIND